MSAFSDALKKFQIKTEQRVKDTFTIATDEVARSIRYGSELTGAPGQPVASGNLLGSWQAERLDTYRWQITTTGKAPDGTAVGYARHVEDNVRGVTFKNGGPHSVKLTRAAWDRIVEFAAKQASGDG